MPSTLLEITTRVALAAVTVSVDEPPEVIEVGLATIVTVGPLTALTVTLT